MPFGTCPQCGNGSQSRSSCVSIAARSRASGGLAGSPAPPARARKRTSDPLVGLLARSPQGSWSNSQHGSESWS
jgi:hypothetical protein